MFLGSNTIFPIFHNGQHQFSVSVDTFKTRDPTFGGLVIESFALGHFFGELWPFSPFSIMVNTNFVFLSTLGKPQTQTLEGVGNWEFCSRTHFWGATSIFPIFHNGRHKCSHTRKTGMTFLHLKRTK